MRHVLSCSPEGSEILWEESLHADQELLKCSTVKKSVDGLKRSRYECTTKVALLVFEEILAHRDELMNFSLASWSVRWTITSWEKQLTTDESTLWRRDHLVLVGSSRYHQWLEIEFVGTSLRIAHDAKRTLQLHCQLYGFFNLVRIVVKGSHSASIRSDCHNSSLLL